MKGEKTKERERTEFINITMEKLNVCLKIAKLEITKLK